MCQLLTFQTIGDTSSLYGTCDKHGLHHLHARVPHPIPNPSTLGDASKMQYPKTVCGITGPIITSHGSSGVACSLTAFSILLMHKADAMIPLHLPVAAQWQIHKRSEPHETELSSHSFPRSIRATSLIDDGSKWGAFGGTIPRPIPLQCWWQIMALVFAPY